MKYFRSIGCFENYCSLKPQDGMVKNSFLVFGEISTTFLMAIREEKTPKPPSTLV